MNQPQPPTCPSCGSPRQSATRFCTQCGTQLDIAYVQPPPVHTPVPPVDMPYMPVYAPAPPGEAPRRRHTGLWISLSVIGLILLWVLIVVVTNAMMIVEHGGTLI